MKIFNYVKVFFLTIVLICIIYFFATIFCKQIDYYYYFKKKEILPINSNDIISGFKFFFSSFNVNFVN